jgi:hypothetical protein
VAGKKWQGMWRWMPPPGWPTPPHGFLPPPGWLPDPAWGPAPTGWNFWQAELPKYQRDMLASGMAPGVVQALGSITWLERRVFGTYLKQMGEAAPEQVALAIERDGFASVCHRQIAILLTPIGVSIGWAAIAAESWIIVTHSRSVSAIAGFVVLLMMAAAGFCFGWRRSRSAKRLRREFSNSGRPLSAAVSPVPAENLRAPLLLLAAIALFALDSAITGLALHQAQFTAPRVTGWIFIGMALVLLVSFVRSVRSRPFDGRPIDGAVDNTT